ncbi:MAG: hypothetical protein ACRECO_11175 [Xanthobacteraceae bacterium]
MIAKLPSLAALAITLTTSGAIAQGVPKLDFGPLCRAQEKAIPELAKNCTAGQTDAREKLVQQWAKFPSGDKAACTRLVTSSPNFQSYVELLTCLQVKQEARNLPKE